MINTCRYCGTTPAAPDPVTKAIICDRLPCRAITQTLIFGPSPPWCILCRSHIGPIEGVGITGVWTCAACDREEQSRWDSNEATPDQSVCIL